MLLTWRNDEKIRSFMFAQHEISLEEHQNWFIGKSKDPSCALLIVEDGAGPFGYVHFNNVIAGGISDWGFYANPYGPRGIGRKLGEVALNYAFLKLKLHKVCGQVLKNNERSIKFHQNLGFYQEGILRDQQFIDGIYYDLICFGLLRHQWSIKSNS